MRFAGLCLGLALAFGACRREPPDVAARPAPKLAGKPAVPEKLKPPELFDAQGRLKPSGRKIAWLDIPMGFEDNRLSGPRHHVFEGHGMNLEQTRDFLAERMLTGDVKDMGGSVMYRGVMSLASEPGAMRFDVTVRQLAGGTTVLLTLDELQFMGVKPLSLDEAKRTLAREQKQME